MASIFMRKPQKKSNAPSVHQFVFIEAPVETVFREVSLWGESAWWPKGCLWQYRRATDGEIGTGTKYVIKINKPSAADWAAEVTKFVPNKLVERTFSKGMFKGHEVVTTDERANGTRVDYELYFTIQGPLNLLLWPLVFKGQYLRTIRMVLNALKSYLQEKGSPRTESLGQTQ